MSKSLTIDAARLELLLTELRLPAMKAMWSRIAEQSNKEGWPAARFLAVLAETEMADRVRRRIARNMADSDLPEGKTVDSFEFELVPMVSKDPGDGAHRRRQLAQGRRQSTAVRGTGGGKKSFGGNGRPWAGRERLAGALRAHHRSRAAAAKSPGAIWRSKARWPSSTNITC
jgi:DNA replication protein DnaC